MPGSTRKTLRKPSTSIAGSAGETGIRQTNTVWQPSCRAMATACPRKFHADDRPQADILPRKFGSHLAAYLAVNARGDVSDGRIDHAEA
jgi:hypothetical protein